MIKGTRMIVITRKKILILASLLSLLSISLTVLFFLPQEPFVTTFTGYKNIIDSQIVPARNEQITEPVKKQSRYTRLLKNFFLLQDNSKDIASTPMPAPTESPPPEIMLQSESVTVDKGMKVSNSTAYNVDPVLASKEPLCFSLDGNGVQVLIMHTHTTESFAEETYIKGAADRNLDETKNISAVGAAMAKVFEKNGIAVIHDRTVHDYPSYNGAYQSAAATINKNLKENPGIKVVLDVHRDGITREDGTKVKLVTEIDGEKCAQVMLVCGTNVNLTHDNWQENFKFASKIQAKAIEMFPSLMRPIDLRQERFNEQLTKGSLIVEVGSNGNTMEEAILGGEKIAEAICAVIK